LNPFLFKPEPPDAETLWRVESGQRVGFHGRYVALVAFLTLLMGLTAALGTISFSTDATAITTFWPAAAFQVVFAVWFGVYGVIAGVVGPMLGNGLVGESPFLFVVSNLVQSSLAGLWFRHRRLDPRLRRRRDWAGLILVGCLLAHAIGAVLGVAETYWRSPSLNADDATVVFWLGKFANWLLGNALPSMLLAPALLKAASSIIVRGPFFCQRFWGGTADALPSGHGRRFSDLPVMAKLSLLMLLSGILPLACVGGYTIWLQTHRAEQLAILSNAQMADKIRTDIERHELLLRYMASELSRPTLDDEEVDELLAYWNSLPETFIRLEIADLEQVRGEMTQAERLAFTELGVGFYTVRDEADPNFEDIRGVIELPSRYGSVLTGVAVWRGGMAPIVEKLAANTGLIVLSTEYGEVHRYVPPALADWTPEAASHASDTYDIKHAGERWHVAESHSPRLRVRIIRVCPVKASKSVVLTNLPNPVAILINLAMFVSVIAGAAVATRISERLLAIAGHVNESGAEPGKLHIPVRGRDELGYLAETLNRMSSDLSDYIEKLRTTTAEKERLAAEMELAREVQLSILPNRPPRVAGYEFAAFCHPAREVGGDFYDVFCDDDGHVIMMIGDAAGKGLRAAMFITQTHGLAHAAALEQPRPDHILRTVNTAFVAARGQTSDFITMFCAVLDTHTQRLSYASAGHNPPLLVRKGRLRELNLGGLPLALFEDGDYRLHELDLSEGDAVVMYTDGITEALNARSELFTEGRLADVLRQGDDASAATWRDRIVASVEAFLDGVPQSDDMTLLILRCANVTSQPAATPDTATV
jgi:hypothetical protein